MVYMHTLTKSPEDTIKPDDVFSQVKRLATSLADVISAVRRLNSNKGRFLCNRR